MLDQYFDVDEKKVGYFFGLVIGAVIIVTLIYWAVFGFDRWTGEMERASDLMMAAAVAPPAQAGTLHSGPGQYVCPRDGAVGLPCLDGAGIPHCPVCNQVMNFHRAPSGNLALAVGPG